MITTSTTSTSAQAGITGVDNSTLFLSFESDVACFVARCHLYPSYQIFQFFRCYHFFITSRLVGLIVISGKLEWSVPTLDSLFMIA